MSIVKLKGEGDRLHRRGLNMKDINIEGWGGISDKGEMFGRGICLTEDKARKGKFLMCMIRNFITGKTDWIVSWGI